MGAEEKLDKISSSYFKTDYYEDKETENNNLKQTVSYLKEELERLKKPALMVGEVLRVYDRQAVIRIPNGNRFYVNISEDIKGLMMGENVLLEQKNLNIIDRIDTPDDLDVEKFVIIEKPKITWKEIGGLDSQINEIKEVIELPLLKPDSFRKVGITPPKGLLLYGVPGTGKTLLAKAVANSTNSTFIEIVGSELVQKFIGEGAKLVKSIFELAKKEAPSIIFIDELDAIASMRMETGTSGEREVQRTFMQLLAELDGFKPLENVKVIGCTNRCDILDPAVVRPGRLDRLIEVPLPDKKGIDEIFNIHTRKMNLGKINREKIYKEMENFSGAEIKAVCTESGYFAIRNNKIKITEEYILKAIKKIKEEEEENHCMFG
ncbi:AAA family ATPase [Candidatus Woesearchaeota archaeon]|nr:AAA family ATPase [Candidatus Woesearchaeota archaeon]